MVSTIKYKINTLLLHLTLMFVNLHISNVVFHQNYFTKIKRRKGTTRCTHFVFIYLSEIYLKYFPQQGKEVKRGSGGKRGEEQELSSSQLEHQRIQQQNPP